MSPFLHQNRRHKTASTPFTSFTRTPTSTAYYRRRMRSSTSTRPPCPSFSSIVIAAPHVLVLRVLAQSPCYPAAEHWRRKIRGPRRPWRGGSCPKENETVSPARDEFLRPRPVRAALDRIEVGSQFPDDVLCFCLFVSRVRRAWGGAEKIEGNERARTVAWRGGFVRGRMAALQKTKRQSASNRVKTTVKQKDGPAPSTSDVSWVCDRSSCDFGGTHPTRVLWTPTRDVLYVHIARSVRTMPSQYER